MLDGSSSGVVVVVGGTAGHFVAYNDDFGYHLTIHASQFGCKYSLCHSFNMASKYIIGSVAASFAVAYICDHSVSDGKLFGGTTTKTVSEEWWEETDKRANAWPRTAGPPVALNPIRRQNFIIKDHSRS
ncbi:hypothetical protein AAG906_034329 [Vitis piasezkii]